MNYSYLPMTKITPAANIPLSLLHIVQELRNLTPVRRNFSCLIMASTKLMQNVYGRSVFVSKFLKEI